MLGRGQGLTDRQYAILQSSRWKLKESWASQSLAFEGWPSILSSRTFLAQICVGRRLPVQFWLLPWDGVFGTDFSCREWLSPSQHISLFTPGWARDHFLCSEAALESPLVLVQGEEVACSTDILDFRPFLHWPLSSHSRGLLGLQVPGNLSFALDLVLAVPFDVLESYSPASWKERSGLRRLLPGGTGRHEGKQWNFEGRVRFWRHFKGRVTWFWWLTMCAEWVGWRGSRVAEWLRWFCWEWAREQDRKAEMRVAESVAKHKKGLVCWVFYTKYTHRLYFSWIAFFF